MTLNENRHHRWALLAILALGFLLRLAGLTAGLPNASHHWSYHPDEWAIPRVAHAILATGDFHPHTFVYGTLTVYLTYAIYRPVFYWWTNPTGRADYFADVYLISRMITLFFSLATLPILYRLGRRLYSARTGLMAALCMALSPGLTLHSQYGTVDVPLTFFVTLALLGAVRVLAEGSWKNLLLAGASVGLAMGCKAQGFIAIFPVLTAIGLSSSLPVRRRWVWGGAALVLTFFFFFLTCPYVLLDAQGYLSAQKTNIAQVVVKGDHAGLWTGIRPWSHHFTHNFPYVLGIPLTIASLAGVWKLLIRRNRNDLVLLAWLIPFSLLLALTSSKFMRYTFPLAPVLFLVGFQLIETISLRLNKPSKGSVWPYRLLAGFCLLSLAIPASLQAFAHAQLDTRDQAAQWLKEQTTPADRIGLLHVPWFYTPPISPYNFGEETRSRFNNSQTNGTSTFKLPLIQSWNQALLLTEKPEYLVISEFEWREEQRLQDPREQGFMAVVRQEYELVKGLNTFPPAWRMVFGQTFAPHDWLYAFPEVRIYRRLSTMPSSPHPE